MLKVMLPVGLAKAMCCFVNGFGVGVTKSVLFDVRCHS
jgi:hypothetical protein